MQLKEMKHKFGLIKYANIVSDLDDILICTAY